MFKRILNYSNKHFKLLDLIDGISDLRAKPQIATADIASSIMSICFSNLGSLNRFNQARNASSVVTIADRIPSASTIARVADSINLESLRYILKNIYLKAKRSKMINPYLGRWMGIVDGHEITSSDICKCCHCSIRNVSKIEGEVKLNYYHRYTAFILAGHTHCFLLDVEPIYPNEAELTSSYRLLSRVCINYPKAFDGVAGDGLYLAGPIFNLLASHNKYTIAVLKDETRELFGEAVALSSINEPFTYRQNNTYYRVWEHKISGLWDSYDKEVTVIRSEETTTVRMHSKDVKRKDKWQYLEKKADWFWVTNLPGKHDLKNIVSVCHSRWQIENSCFNEIVNIFNGDHIYRHSPNAILVFILFLFITVNILNIFFGRNIKNKKIKTKTFLVDLVKAAFLMPYYPPVPIPI